MKKKTFYFFNSGKLSRKQNTLFFEKKDKDPKKRSKVYLPVETIDSLYFFDEVDFNSRLIGFLHLYEIPIFIFDRFGWLKGIFWPTSKRVSGYLSLSQASHFLNKELRLILAKKFVLGAIKNSKRNLQKWLFSQEAKEFKNYEEAVKISKSIEEVMAYEAAAKKYYYPFLAKKTKLEFDKRTRRPPKDHLNCMISFFNSLVYSACLKTIRRTSLSAEISYLHSPSEGRFSLCLDLAEIFKPILTDRLIVDLVNHKKIDFRKDFQVTSEFVHFSDEGKKKVIQLFEEKLQNTFYHKKLRRKVSYFSLIRLECYKLIKHLIGEKEYEPLILN